MRNKLKAITRYGRLFGLLALTASLTVSCAHRKKTASANNPYTSNPYYSTSGDSSSSTASSAGSTQYPTYDDSASYAPADPVTPAATTPQTYPGYTGTTDTAYPSYTGNANASGSYPTDTSYSSGGYTGGGTTHTVAKGENLYRISLRYGTTVSAIQNANGLGSTTIFPGQVIRIP